MTKNSDIPKQIELIRKVSFAAFLALALGAAFLMNGTSQQLRWFYQTKDALAGQGVLAGTSRLIFDIPYRGALVVALLIAAAFAALAVNLYRKQYQKAVKDKVVPLRWIDIGVTSGLLMEILALLHGVQDIAVLKLVAGTTVVSALLAWIAERDNKAGKPALTAYVISVVTGLLPWAVIGGTVVGTALYGGVQLPWYVYALDAVMLVGFVAVAANLLLYIRQRKQWKDYLTVERNYVLVGFLLKVAFAGVLIAALYKR